MTVENFLSVLPLITEKNIGVIFEKIFPCIIVCILVGSYEILLIAATEKMCIIFKFFTEKDYFYA